MDKNTAEILQTITQMLQKHKAKVSNDPKEEYVFNFLHDIDFIMVTLQKLIDQINNRQNELDGSTNVPEMLERNKNAILDIKNTIENCLNNEIQLNTDKMRIGVASRQYDIRHIINSLSHLADTTTLAIKNL